METGPALVLIAGMAAVTYLTRLPLFALSARRVRLPRLLVLVLEQIPIAAFAAIVFPGVLQPGGHTKLAFSNLYVYAALAAVVSARLSRSLLATIVVGVGTAILLEQLI
jgi:branched-subunit amino acid transport protein